MRAGVRKPKKVNLLVDTLRRLEYLAFPRKTGTGGNDCSVQFFDNRIACDGPNAIPSHPGKWDLFSDRPQFQPMTVLIAKNRNISCCYILTTESLILAQNEHWRHGLGMQVERESSLRRVSTVANG